MTPQPAGMVSCRHPLSVSFPSLVLSLSLSHFSRGSLLRSLSHTRQASSLVAFLRTPLTRQPAPMVSCPDSLSLSLCLLLFLSQVIFDPSLLSRPLSRARALALARRLNYICALEDTIDTPTCWNGVLPSPSVIVSSHLWLFPSLLSFLSSLSLARALAQAPGLIKSRVFEDAIHTPTCSNGVLLSLALSLSLSRSLSLSLTLPGMPASGFARRAPHSKVKHVSR